MNITDIFNELEKNKDNFNDLSKYISNKDVINTTENYFHDLFKDIDKIPLKPRLFLMAFMIIHQNETIFSQMEDKEKKLIKSSEEMIKCINSIISKNAYRKTEIIVLYHKQQSYFQNFLIWKENDQQELMRTLAKTWLEIHYKCRTIMDKNKGSNKEMKETDKTWLEGFTNQMKHIEEKIHSTFNEDQIDYFYTLIDTSDDP